jgi:hypothetical protein
MKKRTTNQEGRKFLQYMNEWVGGLGDGCVDNETVPVTAWYLTENIIIWIYYEYVISTVCSAVVIVTFSILEYYFSSLHATNRSI